MEEITITKADVLKYIRDNEIQIEDCEEQLRVLGSNDMMDEWDYQMDEKKKLHGANEMLKNWLLPKFNSNTTAKCNNVCRASLITHLRKQVNLKYITLYENDFETADKILKVINSDKIN